jgi:hypothetical protein
MVNSSLNSATALASALSGLIFVYYKQKKEGPAVFHDRGLFLSPTPSSHFS